MATQTERKTPPLTDGRVLRGERVRAAIVDALLSLCRAGKLRPTAKEVADYAGVSLRSIFKHFENLEALHAEVIAAHSANVRALWQLPVIEGPLPARIVRFVEYHAELYETVAPMRRAGVLVAPESPLVARTLKQSNQALRAQLEVVFQAEIAQRAKPERVLLLDALDLNAGWEAWERLRTVQGLSRKAAERVVKRVLATLLHEAEEK